MNLTKTAVKGNWGTHHGGGIYNNSTLNVYNSTIASNYANQYGGAIMKQAGNVTVTNSILWDNTAGSSGNQIYGTTTTVTCSDVEGGFTGTGNINSNPLFVLSDPAGAGTPKTTGDYHIQSGSPVINQGTATGAPADDMDGDSRPLGSGIDMGADEKE